MSILIKDMEMPKNCAECPVNMNICGRGYKYLLEHPELYDRRADDCPIIGVPPHGRLIDADELIDDVRRHSESYFADDFAHEWVDKAPTVVFADKDGET